MLVEPGGYNEGYAAVPCFWGTAPGSLISRLLQEIDPTGMRVLDLGAGEGKNAAAFARRGAVVDAIECSSKAIENGRYAFADVDINWINVDVNQHGYPDAHYDVVICYGLVHCLVEQDAATRLLAKAKRSLRRGGIFLLASFNDGPHDLSAHPAFFPLLLAHEWYLSAFSGWTIQHASNLILYETHPHNKIPHHHSITRLIAQRP